jgi:hypothetical protein
MHVRMVIEVLSPSVQDGSDADLCAEVLGIRRNRQQRIGGRFEQQPVHLGFVLIGDGADLRRQCEHHVEVGDWQQLGLAGRQPFSSGRPLALRAMPITAGIIGNARVGAVFAALDMTAERGCAARFNCRHDAELAEAQVPGILAPPCLPVPAEDIRHLQLRPRHGGRIRPAVPPEPLEAQADSEFVESY